MRGSTPINTHHQRDMPVYFRDYSDERNTKGGKTSWAYRFSLDHKRYGKSGYRTKSEALDAEARKRNEILNGHIHPKVHLRGTLTDIADDFLEERYQTRGKNTVDHQKPILKNILRLLGKIRIDQITKQDLNKYLITRKKEGLSYRTINIELCVIRCFLEFAKEKKYSIKNVGREFRNHKQYVKKFDIPTNDEFQRFIEECKKTKYGDIFSVWIHLRYATGLRPSESFNLTWDDIRFDHGLIRVVSTESNPLKEGSQRFVDLHPQLENTLKIWRCRWVEKFGGTPPHNFVFYNPQNPTERARNFRGSFRTARRKAGLPWLRSYDLRHYFISWAVMQNIDTQTIMKWAGHKSSAMIDEVYTHLQKGHTKTKMSSLHFGLNQTTSTNPNEENSSEKVTSSVSALGGT